MRRITAESILSKAVFTVLEGDGWRLSWFIPTVEVELCGNSTAWR